VSLTATQISGLTEPGLYRIERGLYLQVGDGGAKSWILRFQLAGRARSMGLGPYRLVPLTEARSRALKAQHLLLDGQDPIEARAAASVSRQKNTPSFEECSRAYIEAHQSAWKNAKHGYQWN
jgi:hypothetical protein